MSHDHQISSTAAGKNKLRIVVALTFTYLIAEIIGSWLSGSLALLADAGHMLTDVAGLVLALVAIHLGERRATQAHSYGYYRGEILAALTNAVILLGVSIYILIEAYRRFETPPEIQTGPMLWIATVGLIVNFVGFLILRSGASQSLNMKGAYFEVLSDMLTSVGVIIGAVAIYFTGWSWIDPAISAGIGLFIFPRTWKLLKESVSILLEGTPAELNVEDLRRKLAEIAGVSNIHDLHVWVLTSEMYAMTVHAVAEDIDQHVRILRDVERLARESFEIHHVTVQLEPAGYSHEFMHD